MNFVFDPSLVLYLPLYDLDGGSLMSKDTYGHLCTVSGASWRLSGRYFDGADDYVNCGNESSLQISQAITLEAFICLAVTPASQATIMGRRQASNDWQFAVNPSRRLYFTFWSGGVEKTALGPSNTALALENWYHVATTYDGIKAAHYINGSQDKSADISGAIDTGSTATLVGAVNMTALVFQGIIGEVRLYRRVLTPAEIQRNYLATKWRYR